MLLEQHKEAVLNLLSNPTLLEEQVNFALKTLKEYVIHWRLLSVKKIQTSTFFKQSQFFLKKQPLSLQVNSNFQLLPFRQGVEETDVSDLSDTDDKERLGDKLFSLVEKLDPLHANDITGKLILYYQGIVRTHVSVFLKNAFFSPDKKKYQWHVSTTTITVAQRK